jgi:hypothetical protein
MSFLNARSLLWGTSLLVAFVAVPALAEDRTVTVTNKTSSTLTEFYASRTGINDWEEDIMGQDTLAPDESIEIDIDDGTKSCLYDFKGVFKDGESAVMAKVNVCEISQFNFTE